MDLIFKRAASLCLSAALLAGPALAAGTEAPADRAESARQAVQAAGELGGAVSMQYALWEKGEITLSGHLGTYSRTENRALTDDILYGVGSVSKTYTAAAVMKLAEAGKVELDAPVTDYLPDFTMADPRYKDITLRMLLDHSSGLMGSTMGNAFLLGDPADRSATDELLERLSTQSLKADPGAYSVYCNDGFTLAQLVVEAVSGQSLEAYLRAQFFTPMGLEDTFAPADEFDRGRLAKLYLGEDARALPPESIGVLGTGGFYATASDLASFGGLFCGEGLLSQASLDTMAAPAYKNGLWAEDTDDLVHYGLGWDSVEFPPFAYSGIQALVKGGDTMFHAGLVVLPEYDMACAVLSSGGVSTYNELAASRILLDALAQRGVEVDRSPRALAPAEAAQMPAGLMEHAGLYGSNAQMAQVDITADGVMSITYLSTPGPLVQTFTYRADGTFRNEADSAAVRPVEEENGQVYLWQKGYNELPGLAQMPFSNYYLQKLPESGLTPEQQAQWDARGEKLYLLLNEKFSSQMYPMLIPATGLPMSAACPGYMLNGMRLLDGDRAASVSQIPNLMGRDGGALEFYREDGQEYLSSMGSLYVESAAAQPLWGGAGAYATIQADGHARWYTVGELAGKTLSVALPERGGFAVYDANGQTVAASWAFGDASVLLPEGGWIVFAGDAGTRFHLETK